MRTYFDIMLLAPYTDKPRFINRLTDKPIPSLFVMDGRLPQGPGPPGPEPEPPPNPKCQPIGAECASLPTITAVAAPASRLGAPHHPIA